MRLYTDRSGNLWVGTWGGGLNKLLSSEITVKSKERKQYFIRYQHYNNDIHSIIGNSIYSIFEDRSGVLWIGTDWNGLSRYDQDKAKFAHYQSDPNMPNQLNDNTIQSIYKDEYDNLWIGTSSGGLNMYDKKTDQYIHYLHNPHDPHSLSHNTVRTVYKDRSGNLWIGTETGLNQYDKKKERFIRYFSDRDDPSTTNITSICEDHDGYLWLGNWGKGLCRFDPAKKTFKTYQHDANDPNSISDNIIYCITEDQQGRLWIGTEHGGLNRFDKKSNRFIHYMYDEKDTTSLSDNKVLTLMQSATGDIWVGTTAGLNRMIHNDDPEAIPVFKHYTVADGLSSNTIQGILEDDHGNLWICNGDYLVTLNPKTETFRSYDVYDRLQGGEFSLNAVFKDKDTGEMYLGGVNGFNIFHPDSIKDNPVAPNIAITNFKLSNKSIHPGGIVNKRIILEKSITVTDKIILSHTDDVISFEFAALHFNSPENNKYAFMLENFEKTWNYVGNKREATYTNLDPGEYIFRVKASNHDGVWNEKGTSKKIIITPPFWQTWWFRILMITITISLIYLIYKIRVRNIETHRRELEITVKKRTQQLVEKTEALEVSKKETDNILHNVEEGFFLLDREYKISSQYSSALETIFSSKEIAHLNLLDFYSDKITESDIENTRMYLEFLFDEKMNENSIQHLNPLVDLEFTFSKGNYLKKGDNSKISKYLNFSFKRIKSDGNKIAELIVTVRDVTRSILLAKQLKEEEARRERLLQLMLGILDVDPEMLNEFSESAQRELAFIDKIINHSEIEDYQALLVKVFRATHLIKGNAKLLNIDYFAQAAHQFEDMISEVQKKTHITDRDIDPLREKVRELETGIEEMERIIERMGQIHTQKGLKKGIDTGTLLQSLENLINSFSSDLGKKIKFNYKKFNGHIIPVKYHLLVKEVLIQLIRNAISHGIEFPEERKRLKKPQYGKIEISTFKKNGSIGFRLRDDGRGIQIKKLKEKALQSGKWDKEEIEKWDDNKTAELIFASGISTAEQVDMIAGRGVGMDGVIHRLKEYRGEIQVHFTEGQYCEFEIILPTAA
jgi:ligand-binding sensor domain-containing protein/signal transduction histidine kinase